MIPTLLLVGLVVGLLPRRWPNHLAVGTVILVLISVGWGIAVSKGAVDPGPVDVLAGAALAFVNGAIGMAIGLGVQRAFARLSPAPRPH
jgi:hypothetical protein